MFFITIIFILSLVITYFFLNKPAKEVEVLEVNKITRMLKHNLNDKEVWLLDYENCHYIPTVLLNKGPETICYIFINYNNYSRLQEQIRLFDSGLKIECIYTKRAGRNYEDIEIATYVGMIVSKYNPKSLTIFSNDNGYDVVINALDNIGIDNVKLFKSNNEELLSIKRCEYIYVKVKRDLPHNKISLGNFKKKIKNTIMNINADEINYLINYLVSHQRIDLITNYKNEKFVLLK